MHYLLFLKKQQNFKLSSAANYRWCFKGNYNALSRSKLTLVMQSIKGWKILKNFYSSYITICIDKFNNLHWKQSTFLLVLQHKALAMASGRVDFSRPGILCTTPLPNFFILFNLKNFSCKHIISIRVEHSVDPDQMASSEAI